jgi:hypothetical protein
MARVDIPLTGPAYKHRSPPVSAQTCRNWFPEIVTESPYQAVLAQVHGSRHFAKTVFTETVVDDDVPTDVVSPMPSAKDRGLHIFKNKLYKVTGGRLFRVDANGAQTLIGTVSGSKRCVFASNADDMIIVTGGLVYRFNGSSLRLASSPAFEQPQAVAYLNSQAIYDGLGSRFVVSNPGDLAIINGLNYAAAESSGDDLVRPYAYQQTLYLMGTATIESWYNSGSGNPPFARIDGGSMQVGLGAIYSTDHNNHGVFFLGADRSVYVLNGANAQPISTIPLAQEFATYSRVDNAIGFCFKIDDQDFYQLTFPTVNKTWCYNVQSAAWFERATGYDAHLATSYAFCYGKHLIAHDQYVLEWRPELCIDGDAIPLEEDAPEYPPTRTIIRERVTATITGKLLGAPGRDLHMGRLELEFQAGDGTANGQGIEPEIMMSFSDDAGRTWSNEMRGQIGRMGNFLATASWDGLGSFQARVVRFRVSDPVHCTLLTATADIEAGI